jgi:hypothetical protein
MLNNFSLAKSLFIQGVLKGGKDLSGRLSANDLLPEDMHPAGSLGAPCNG